MWCTMKMESKLNLGNFIINGSKKMKIMRRINYILLSLFLLVGFSCVKDALKTDFIELDEVMITGIEKRYDIMLGGEVNITPTITTKFGAKEEDFEFIWYKYNLSAASKADTLCFEKNLSVKINDVAPGIEHFIRLKVIDKKTKTFTLATAQLFTSAKYSGGVLALVKTDNEVDLAFIKNGKDNVDNNLFSLANDGQKLSPTSFNLMSVDAVLTQPTVYRRILIGTGDENIGVYLSSETFAVIDWVRDLFFTPMTDGVYKLKATYNSQGDEYLLLDDKLYNRTMNRYDGENTPKFNASPVPCVAEPTNFSLATFAYTPSGTYGSPVVFDNINGRFMIHESGAKAYSFFTNSSDGAAFAVFDPKKLPGLTMVCGGYFSDDSSDNMWGLMKDTNSGNFRVVSMLNYIDDDWNNIFKTLGNKEITRSMAPKLFEATNIKSASYAYVAGVYPWAYEMRGLKNMFLYVVDNKLYVYNITSDYEGLLVDGDAEGFTIDDVFVHRTYLTVDKDGNKEYFSRIALAIKDKQGSGKKGGVAYYKVTVLGGVSATQYFKKTGFCDQVLSLDEKIN